jgi:hypothetical protein
MPTKIFPEMLLYDLGCDSGGCEEFYLLVYKAA